MLPMEPRATGLPLYSRRHFLRTAAATASAVAASSLLPSISSAQAAGSFKGERPPAPPEGVTVLPPMGRLPVSLIIDDSTCLVNLNRFAIPQFAAAWAASGGQENGKPPAFDQPWRTWPSEIPDAFVRKFGEWSSEHGVKGKFSVVPFPACVGRLDRGLPGWTKEELDNSIKLVREVITPNWDIHPEMVTHTRVIDTKTGHPYPELSLRFMENWIWSAGRSADELANYMAYALRIIKEIGLPCEGITTPGGFGNQALRSLSLATLQSVRDVFGAKDAEIPHYFRHLYDKGPESVAPRVEFASGIGGDDPRCSVSIIGCTGDWTGGWDCSQPVGADAFISPDLQSGRVVDVIARGEPACMVAHWTGIYYNGQEIGFKIFQEVTSRLRQRYGNRLLWMKLGEIARYAAANELTHIERSNNGTALTLNAPFACPQFTLRVPASRGGNAPPEYSVPGAERAPLKEASAPDSLQPGTFARPADGGGLTVCFALPRGKSQLHL